MEATDGEVRLVGVTRRPYTDPRLKELRLAETRPVARLMHRVAHDYPQDKPLFRAAYMLVIIADHLNAIIAGLGDYPDGPGKPLEGTDWSGLPIDATKAKRATLCIRAGKALGLLAIGQRDKCLAECEAVAELLGKGVCDADAERP